MKDKINKLAKGIMDLETPELMLTPESVSDTIPAGRISSFIIELQSRNGYSVKGICTTDDPRVHPEPMSFAGRRVHITIRVNTAGLQDGDTLKGNLCFLTNAGEFTIPYSLTATEERYVETRAPGMPEPEYIRTNPIHFEEELIGPAFDTFPELPEDEDSLMELVSDLIRSEDDSAFAFHAYKEAIRRGLSINRLYESYVMAYPLDATEEMPREVLLYFSYDQEIPHALCEALYANVILYQDADSEIFESFAYRMSRYAYEEALAMQMSPRLAIIYDRMTEAEMIDVRSAAALGEIFRCHEIRVTDGWADFLLVSYPELKGALRAPILNGVSYVPIVSDNAIIRFYREEDREKWTTIDASASVRYLVDGEQKGLTDYTEVTELIRYHERSMFERPEVLQACAAASGDHKVQHLEKLRQIADRGSCTEEEKELLTEALSGFELNPDFRNRLIAILAGEPGTMDWIRFLKPEDLTFAACGCIFSGLIRENCFKDAYELIRCYGSEFAGDEELSKLADGILTDAVELYRRDEVCVKLCKRLFDAGCAPKPAVELLCAEYNGSAAAMSAILKTAVELDVDLYDMPERMITIELFTGESIGMDEAFRLYIQSGKYEDLVLRAYLAVRSADFFLKEQEPGAFFFESLYSYLKASEDPFRLPLIYHIALTAYYADRETLNEDEKRLCQLLTNRLIEDGMVFRYTKKLRRNIVIPEEIINRFYIEYRGNLDAAPKLLIKILPDEKDYHAEEMRRVFRNIYVMSTVLFIGDELHYLIYDTHMAQEPAEEGIIHVTKLHRQANDRMTRINLMMKALKDRDEDLLKENMLQYVENSETVKALFRLEN